MANLIGFIGLGVGAFALLCSVLACALPYWLSNESYNGGLWKTCYDAGSGEVCVDPTELTEDVPKLKAVRAMVLLGLLANVGGLVTMGLLLFVMKDMKILGFIGGGVCIAAGMFHMIGMAIYIDDLSDDRKKDLGAGFAFVVLAWLTSWAAAGPIIWVTISGGDPQVSAKGSA